VRAARSFGAVRRLLIFGIVMSVVVAGGLAALGVLQVASAQRALEEEQARTAQLLAQQAQFAEVPKVLGALRDAEDARTYAMATDVLWAPYLRAIAAVLPEDVSIDKLTIETEAPLLPLAPIQNPLVDTGVARITFATRSADVPDTTQWLDALDSLPGFRDAFFTSHLITEKDGSVFYEVETTVELDATVHSGRFVPAEGVDDGPSAPEPGSGDSENGGGN